MDCGYITQVRHHTRLDACTCFVCFTKIMMMICQYYYGTSLPIEHAWSRSQSFYDFSEMVSHQICCTVVSWFAKAMATAHCRKVSLTVNNKTKHLETNRQKRTLGYLGAFSTQVGKGAPFRWALRFLVVKEIDCGDWLTRGCLPAHQPCELFYPPAGDLIGSALY